MKHYVFFNKETGVAEHMMYTPWPQAVEHVIRPTQVAVEIGDTHGWELLTLQDVNRKQTEEDANG